MGNRLTPQALRYHAPVLVCLLAILVLIFLPTGFEGALLYQEAERCKAEVLSVDDSAIIDTGLVRSGEQRCQLEILDGAFAGQTVTGINMLNGSLEQDKIFAPGDVAQVVVSHDGDTITNVTMTDHYRLGWEALMAVGFAVFLILFAGRTGVRAIASFALTVLTLWKVLVPLYLKGWNPIWVGLAITLFLTLIIIALVYGFDRRCWAAVSGSFLGILVTLYGIFKFIRYYQIKNQFHIDDSRVMMSGVSSIVIGILTILLASFLTNAIQIITGIWLIFSGLTKLGNASLYKTNHPKLYISELIIAVLFILLGMILSILLIFFLFLLISFEDLLFPVIRKSNYRHIFLSCPYHFLYLYFSI